MRRTKRIPQRKHCVVREVRRFVCLEIASAILPVNVHEDVGRAHRVIQTGVEVCELGVAAAGDYALAELAVPCGCGIGSDFIKIPMIEFRAETTNSAIAAHGGDSQAYENGVSIAC